MSTNPGRRKRQEKASPERQQAEFSKVHEALRAIPPPLLPGPTGEGGDPELGVDQFPHQGSRGRGAGVRLRSQFWLSAIAAMVRTESILQRSLRGHPHQRVREERSQGANEDGHRSQ
eukprot:gene13734-biopygen10423